MDFAKHAIVSFINMVKIFVLPIFSILYLTSCFLQIRSETWFKDAPTFIQFDQEELEECEKRFNNGGVKAAEDFLKDKAAEWSSVPLNVAVTGNSGVGKSSFVNAIRVLTADDHWSAGVGEREKTTEPTPYAHPNNPQLKFWDLPGVGTPKWPREKYLEKVQFDRYDFFLILSSERFTENDLWLAKEIASKGKKFFFIRTKIDSAIENDKRAHPKTHNQTHLLVDIRENINENLGKLYEHDRVFLIDSYNRTHYDFNRLDIRLIEEFPRLKRDALILSLGAFSKDMIKRKVEVLRSGIWKMALLSGTVALVPVPGVSVMLDIGLILSSNSFYFSQLGLEEDALNRTARIMSCSPSILQSIVADCEVKKQFLTVEGIKTFIQMTPWMVSGEMAEEVARWIPGGMLVAGGISYWTTYKTLDMVLNRMEETAMKVIKQVEQGNCKAL